MDANPHQGSTDIESESSAPTLDAETMISAPADASLPWEPLAMTTDFGPSVGDGAAADEDTATGAAAVLSAGPHAAEVDKIREILFGQQISEYESRFAQLEIRLAREIEAVRDDIIRRFEKVQSQVTQDFTNLSRQIGTEQKYRAEEISALNGQFRAAREELESAVTRASGEAEAATEKIREVLEEETARQQEAVAARTEEIERRLEAVTSQLRRDKVDRSSMEALFEQLAAHFGTTEPTFDDVG